MMMATGYRGFYLQRVERTELWNVTKNNGKAGSFAGYDVLHSSVDWNTALMLVDVLSTEPVVPSLICKLCGHRELLTWSHNKELKEHQMCFTCNFWREVTSDPDRLYIEEADGIHAYLICEESATSMFRGFGGRGFTVEMLDGSVVKTTNLWSQGVMPELWKRPPNARFL